MATEKQVSYIKSLVNGLKFENVPYLNKPFDLGGQDESLRAHALKCFLAPRREWMLRGLYRDYNPYFEKFETMTYDDAKSQWIARIAELELVDFSILDNRQASQMIDDLKKFFIGE